jgi:hypothetical protein
MSLTIERTRPQVEPVTKMSPTASEPSCTSTGGDDAAAGLLARLEHDALRRHLGARLELEDVGGEQDHLEQGVDALLLERRDRHRDRVAAPVLGIRPRSESSFFTRS